MEQVRVPSAATDTTFHVLLARTGYVMRRETTKTKSLLHNPLLPPLDRHLVKGFELCKLVAGSFVK